MSRSSSSSSSSSRSIKVIEEPVTAHAETNTKAARVEEDPERRAMMFDWNQKITCGCCSCLSFLLQLILVAASGSFLFGMNIGLLNTSIDYIAWEYKWCDFSSGGPITGCTAYTNYSAFVSTGVFIGAAIGSMTGGVFMAFGRRGMMLLSMAVFVLGIVSSVCANSFSALVWARLICGYAVGLVSVVVPCYMSEVTPAAVRGFYGVFHQLFVTVGLLVASLLGLPLALKSPMPTNDVTGMAKDTIDIFASVWWRVMLGFGIIPVGLTAYLLGFVYTFETPHYYVENGSPQDAEQLLMKITQKADVGDELKQIMDDIEISQKAKAAGMTLGQAWKRPDYRYVIIYGCVLSAFQQFSGINVFMASSNALFQQAGLSGHWPTIMSNIMNLINCVMTFPAVPLIEKLGRRSLLFAGTIVMTVGVAPAAICYWALEDGSKITQWLAIVGCLVFIIGFACTYGPILWVYLFEIYPTEIKGAAAGLATAFNWIAGIIMVFVSQYLNSKTKWLVFMIMCGLGATIIGVGMKETKGRALGDSPYIKN